MQINDSKLIGRPQGSNKNFAAGDPSQTKVMRTKIFKGPEGILKSGHNVGLTRAAAIDVSVFVRFYRDFYRLGHDTPLITIMALLSRTQR